MELFVLRAWNGGNILFYKIVVTQQKNENRRPHVSKVVIVVTYHSIVTNMNVYVINMNIFVTNMNFLSQI